MPKTVTLWYSGYCYLVDRTHFDQSGSHRSCHRKISCSVPLGSSISPLMFIAYIDDFPNASTLNQCLCLLMIQALFVSIEMPTTLLLLLTMNLQKLDVWLKVNKLSLNITKTNFMIFHPRQKKVNVNVPLTLENTVIKQVTETKFLGVLIDQHLSWKPHIDFVSKKNLEKCGNYCESPFLPTISNLDDLILLPGISFLNIL